MGVAHRRKSRPVARQTSICKTKKLFRLLLDRKKFAEAQKTAQALTKRFRELGLAEAWCETAKALVEKIGPRPFSILKQKGIPCYTGINPRIEHIIEAVKAGEVTGPANEATEEPHAGQEEHF